MASPTETSAAARVRTRMNMICPSGCDQRAPAAMKASPAAFSMTSMDMSVKMRLRRASTPTRPRTKRMIARRKAWLRGTPAISPLLMAAAEVIGGDEAGEQQHGGQLHRQEIGAVEGDPDLLGGDHPPGRRAGAARCQGIAELGRQDGRQKRGPGPGARPDPLQLLRRGGPAEVEHHDGEDRKSTR